MYVALVEKRGDRFSDSSQLSMMTKVDMSVWNDSHTFSTYEAMMCSTYSKQGLLSGLVFWRVCNVPSRWEGSGVLRL